MVFRRSVSITNDLAELSYALVSHPMADAVQLSKQNFPVVRDTHPLDKNIESGVQIDSLTMLSC
jgi:hypothetical protein